MLSTSALALTVFGNNSQKGSLVIFPRIQVTPADFVDSEAAANGPAAAGVDTLITITNDSALPVRLKCYYATSDPLPTPFTGTAAGARRLKHFEDFTIDLTHNQPVAWWASTGEAYSNSQAFAGFVAPPFGNPFPDGVTRDAGELKCWAISDDGSTEKSHNHLFGTASVFSIGTGQAYEYTAWTFQTISAAAEASLGSPGVLNLDNVEYDACPNILLGDFLASGVNANATQVTLASCNQDLRQAFTPTITKLTWTFFNQDEAARTGTHFCADSWYETEFPSTNFPFAGIAGLGTEVGYFRIETTADTQVCGPDAQTSAYVGVVAQRTGAGNIRGTNLTGRGPAFGVIKYDPF